MNLQTVPAIVKETQLSEPVHEETDPRPGGADHVCQSFLTDPGDDRLGHAFLAEMSQQQQNASESLFARVEELVD